jgi:hypothetical protein
MAVRGSVTVVALVLVGLSGCSSAPPVDPNAPTVLVSGSGDGSGAAALIAGPITVDDRRCVGVGEYLVIWPEGTAWDTETDGLRLPNGDVRKVGETVSGGGYYVTGTSAQSSLADIAQRNLCSWEGETAIFNPGSQVESATP